MIYNSQEDWFQALYDNNYDLTPGGTPPESAQTGDLPFLSYTLKRQTAVTLNGVIPQGQTKMFFNWNYTEKEPYKSTPGMYTFDIMAYSNFKQIEGVGGLTSTVFDKDNITINTNNQVFLTKGGQNISTNSFSFLYDDIGRAIYSKSNVNWEVDSTGAITTGYILGIRTKNYQNTQFSWWKLFVVNAGGYVTSTGKVMKPDGTIIDSTAENSNDNMDTSNNGTAGYTEDSSTTAGSDTTGDVYDESGNIDASSIINNLKGLVNQVGNIPAIFATLLTFIPSWFITFLVVSIGLFVTIGLVKVIVH